MINRMINCYHCGSWIKPDKQGDYKCPKCKSMYRLDADGRVLQYYNTSEKESMNEE